MDLSKYKLETIMELCGEIIEDMSHGDDEDENEEGMLEEMAEAKPVAAIEVTKVSKPKGF
jgi:hypothetical protein